MEASDKGSSSNKGLIALLFFLILVIAILGVTLYACMYTDILELKQPKPNSSGTEQCDTDECHVIAGEMIARMNRSADPCTDFYQYACGQYANPSNRPPDVDDMSTTLMPETITTQQLNAILSSPGDRYRDRVSTAVVKVKKFYSVCMNDTEDDAKGRAVILRVIKNLQSWPLSTDSASGTWNSSTWSFQSVMDEAAGQGFTPLFDLQHSPHLKNSKKNLIIFKASGLALQQGAYYHQPSAEKAYRSLFEDILKILYGPTSDSRYNDWSGKIWSFEKSVADLFPPTSNELELSVKKIENIVKMSDMQKNVTFINVRQFIKRAFEGTSAKVAQVNEVLVAPQGYFDKLNTIIINLGNQSTEILATYIVWNSIYEITQYAGKSFSKAHKSFKSTLYGTSIPNPPKWKQCTDDTVKVLGFAIGALHAQKHFDAKDEKIISHSLQLTIDEFVANLPRTEWLEKETRKKVEQKARAVSWHIGYPKLFDNPHNLDEFYRDFTVRDSTSENALEFNKFNRKNLIKKFSMPVDRNEWHTDIMPTHTNALYSETQNQIYVLSGVLQKPVYSRNYPKSVFYGALGSVLGHELTHGFDTTGRHYDSNGNMVDWWDSKSAKAYQERAECIRAQYSKLKFQGLEVNGNATLGENIADCGAVALAYRVYTKAVREKEANFVEATLPGLKLTGPQQFFLAFAQNYCINMNDKRAALYIRLDYHSYGPVRANTALKNTPKFAEAFNCPSQSQMNPDKRCSIWT